MIKYQVFKTVQRGVEIYTSIIPSSDILQYGRIDWWTQTNPKGYQRPLIEERVQNAAKYLLDEDGIFPTSVLLNIRGRIDYNPGANIDSNTQLGVLFIPDSSLPMWIIDGQHRIYSILYASRENTEFENYSIPVTITNFKNRYEEMRQFYIVNRRQKRVKTDLAQRHLMETIFAIGETNLLEHETRAQILEAQAVPVVDYLRLDPKSPWYGQIQIPSDKKKEESHIITQTTFAKTLSSILKNFTQEERLEIMESPKSLGIVLVHYWNALKSIFPRAFANPKEYSIQKSFCVHVFHRLFYDVYDSCKKRGKISETTFRTELMNILSFLSEREDAVAMDDSFWHRVDGHYLTKGSNMKMVREFHLILSAYYEDEDVLE